jgi:pimeloyl-ACP methyl ester carboxylesterase
MPESDKPLQRNYQLVTTVTPDMVKLHGLFQPPHQTGGLPVDAAIVLHGLGGNFYSSSLNLRLADALRQAGLAVLLANTRGHDGISMNPVNGRAETIGAAYEIVDDCRHDVAGWIDWLLRREYSRIVLVGHSLGAIKSLYAQAFQPHAAVQAIVGLSATRLSHNQFMKSERAADFRKWFELAVSLVGDGRGDELLRVDFPFPTHMTAAAYADKYGPQDRYDWTRFAGQISVPVLLMFGERELRDNAAFQGLLPVVGELARQLPHFRLRIIESANHFYAGVHWRATAAMREWMADSLH